MWLKSNSKPSTTLKPASEAASDAGLEVVKGQAMMLVITILALLFVVGVAFFSLAQVERASSLRYLESLKARYVAEAGIEYARQVLELDRQTSLIDSLDDLTFQHFLGQEIDLDGDAKPDGRWFSIADSQGNPFGRFSLLLRDEAGKINLNTTSQQVLEELFSQLKIDSAKAATLISHRPFNAIEEIAPILGKKEFAIVKDSLTIYSADQETDLERKIRAYLNSASGQIILETLLDAGVRSPFQLAANLKDASDLDISQTRLDEFARGNILPTALVESGSWVKNDNYYEALQNGASGKFAWLNLPVSDGDYFCFFYGLKDSDCIGEVYLDGEENLAELLYSGEALAKKAKVNSGLLVFNIKPAKAQSSRFSYIELVSPDYRSGLTRKTITGTEALVLNELMVKPSQTLLMDTPITLESGESFSHIFSPAKPGYYYLIVLAEKEGGLVGTVSIGGRTADGLYDKTYFPYTTEASADGSLTVEVKNNSLGSTTFKGIEVLRQPDAEFIEVLNVSGSEIDLSNFSFAVYSAQNELVPGWPGRIPEGTKIAPYQHIVFTVDNNDADFSPNQLKGNKIYFQKIWGFKAVGLVFDEYLNSIDKSFDLLPDKGGRVILKDNLGRQVDSVEYLDSNIKDFISLERSDPSAKTDADQNGLFDGWFLSEGKDGGTPSSVNQNQGMIKQGLSTVVVFNRPLSELAETRELSDGKGWGKFTLLDIARMSDHFAAQALTLDLTGHYKSGEFVENNNAFESKASGDSGVWEFNDIAKGDYLLSIVSDKLAAEGEKIRVGCKTKSEEDFREFSSLLFAQGISLYGRVALAQSHLNFQLKIINDSQRPLRLKAILLEPVNVVAGRINVNTARREVLNSILASDALAQAVLNNRPLGIKDGRNLGVGELFLLDENFLSYHNSLTVKSDVYEINSRGEYFPQGKTQAFQLIRSVVERGE